MKAGEEPLDFTKEFVGWSNEYAPKFEDPYEKRLRLERERRAQELEEKAETIAEDDAASSSKAGGVKEVAAVGEDAGGKKAHARWGRGRRDGRHAACGVDPRAQHHQIDR